MGRIEGRCNIGFVVLNFLLNEFFIISVKTIFVVELEYFIGLSVIWYKKSLIKHNLIKNYPAII